MSKCYARVSRDILAFLFFLFYHKFFQPQQYWPCEPDPSLFRGWSYAPRPSIISGLCPVGAIASPLVMAVSDIYRHYQMFPEGQNSPQLRTISVQSGRGDRICSVLTVYLFANSHFLADLFFWQTSATWLVTISRGLFFFLFKGSRSCRVPYPQKHMKRREKLCPHPSCLLLWPKYFFCVLRHKNYKASNFWECMSGNNYQYVQRFNYRESLAEKL